MGQPVWKRDFRELPFTETELLAIVKTFERSFEDEDGFEAPITLMGRRAAVNKYSTLR